MLDLEKRFKILFENDVSTFNRDDLPESSFKYQLLGLNLLRLLAQNKLADFHTVSRVGTDHLLILSQDLPIDKKYIFAST